jgi:hypothetical protein
MLTENQMFLYMKELVSRAKDDGTADVIEDVAALITFMLLKEIELN